MAGMSHDCQLSTWRGGASSSGCGRLLMFARARFLRLQSSNVRAQKYFYINENGSSIGVIKKGRATMDFHRRSNWTSVALVVALAIGMPWTAGAQGQRGAVAEPYT